MRELTEDEKNGLLRHFQNVFGGGGTYGTCGIGEDGMKVTKPGEIVKFSCGACGCEFVAGINAARTNDKGENYYCHCPTCGNDCHADVNKRTKGEWFVG